MYSGLRLFKDIVFSRRFLGDTYRRQHQERLGGSVIKSLRNLYFSAKVTILYENIENIK